MGWSATPVAGDGEIGPHPAEEPAGRFVKISEPVALSIDRFAKRYGAAVAVKNLSFVVRAKEVVGLIGPNGSGKTTTLRAAAGLVQPTRGRIHVGGHDVHRSPLAAKRLLGMVTHEPQLFPSLTVREHLELMMRLYGIAPGEDHGEELLDRFGLRERAHDPTDVLSRGLQQKTALVCALAIRPRVLLLDEPLNSLDPSGIQLALEQTRSAAERGAAVVISSHLLGHVERICDRFVLLDRGEKVGEGDRSTLNQNFADTPEGRRLEALFFRFRAKSTDAP